MEDIPYTPSWPADSRTAQVLPLSAEDIAYLQARKKKLGSGMKIAAIGIIGILFFRFVIKDSDPGLIVGFGILAVLGIGLFWYLFARRINKTLDKNTKHVGRARIAQKVSNFNADTGTSTLSLILDWEFKDKLAKVYPTDKVYNQLTEGELVEIQVATFNKLVLAVRKPSTLF
ncbi:hypothetical protein [Persicitalea jodogahamensis]|uniref:Uncharacterized protein n=1 Tax=Persicitalea jodogahamensis TaxID=402147 RepID=A0A8J3G8Y4_9BACT|nr:hypothetical protein [Persicitalea jodogahamensis]GHB62331.1 hypothetical protein GCM10007390_15170 [Persicitalea jodogahamensis]